MQKRSNSSPAEDPSEDGPQAPPGPESQEGGLKSAAEIALERSAAGGTAPSPAESSSKELEELRARAAKAQEHWDRLLRAQADLENYRKRVTKERQEWARAANEKLLLDLLIPLDHFEIGLQSLQQHARKDPLREGMEMVLGQFQQFLKSQGITEIRAVGEKFDPALHEAVAEQESEGPEGQVIQQLRKGYRLQNKVLRPSSVIVSKGSGAGSEMVPRSPAPEATEKDGEA